MVTNQWNGGKSLSAHPDGSTVRMSTVNFYEIHVTWVEIQVWYPPHVAWKKDTRAGFLYVWDKHHRGTCAIISFADPSRKSKETFAAVSWSIAYAVAGFKGDPVKGPP